jgi:hypothetical protein
LRECGRRCFNQSYRNSTPYILHALTLVILLIRHI